jgi:hypothetical protein
VALLNVDVGMPQGRMSVLSAIEYAVESLVRVYEEDTKELDLPILIGLQRTGWSAEWASRRGDTCACSSSSICPW